MHDSQSDEKQFASADVMQLARITERQLRWWTEKGLVGFYVVLGSRCFSKSDVLRAMLIAELKRRGCALSKIRKMSIALNSSIGRALEAPDEMLLASDRRTLRLIGAREPINSLPESLRGIFLIPISEFIRRIHAHVPGKRTRTYVSRRAAEDRARIDSHAAQMRKRNASTFRRMTAAESSWQRKSESGEWMRGQTA